MSDCKNKLMNKANSGEYTLVPRSCPRCKFGPCKENETLKLNPYAVYTEECFIRTAPKVDQYIQHIQPSVVIQRPPISETIKNRLKTDNKRFFACDNVSDYITDDERTSLIAELTDKFTDVLKSLIIDIDNDPNSKDTGKRLAKMYVNEIMSGRFFPQPESTSFPNEGQTPYEGMLVVRADLKSICSHHHQPVSGTAYIGIIPGKTVIGLSKYIRIAQHIARRGTLQEELCVAINQAIREATGSEDVGVYIEAQHGCVSCRGVNQENSLTQTTVLQGEFHKSDVKKEFFDNIHLQKLGK